MKLSITSSAMLMVVIIIGIASCKKEDSCEGCGATNKAPIAKAGVNQSIALPTDSVLLDGSTSTDPDGTIIEWYWSKIAGPPSFIINNPAIARPIVRNLQAGIYHFELLVKDDDGLSAKDTVQVTVTDPSQPNRPPVAYAGADQTVLLPIATVNLNGSGSSDPDNNIISYNWTKIAGPSSFNISNPLAVQTQVVNLTIGTYEFELKVTDAGGLFDKDTIVVTVAQSLPPPCGQVGSIVSSCSGYWVCTNLPGAQSIGYTYISNFYQAYGASVSTQSKIYFAGGHDDFWAYGGSLPGGIEYDPITNSVRCFTLSAPRSFLAGAKAGNKILFGGGNNVSGYTTPSPVYSTVDIYDEQSLAHTVANLSEARSHLASISLDNNAYFIGGKTQNGFSAKMDVYNAVTNSWQVINLPRERGYAGAAMIGNNIYIAGGKNNAGNIRTIDIYNVQSGQWSSIETPNDHPIASVAAINNKLIVAGGDGLNNKSADIYNSTTGQWTSVNLSDSRFNITVASANNKIVLLGGATTFPGTGIWNESGAIDVYNDNTGTWSAGGISPGVNGVMASSLGNKIVYVGFMSNGSTTITNTMMIIIP